ncbi:MAG: DNA primase [Bacteroidaceae bacterium]|nr:DNA primase [Bacteroidaceae bacterium]
MIRQESIDRVLEAANIVEVVSKSVSLKRAGTNLKGLCPFHQDSTPSLMVSPAKNIYKCFACGEGGGPVKFVMKHEGLSFYEAVRSLAKRYDIVLDESMPTAEEQAEYRLKESLWAALELVEEEYRKQLLKCKEASAYAYNRWGKEYCSLTGIGYCPKNARLIDGLGLTDEVVEKLHLKNNGGFDFFSGRITIPIRDRQQRIIGFTARAFDDPEQAKYMNSKESLIYNKSVSVFGIDTAWREARKTEAFYLVEGAPDCMRLQSIGILNTVAPLGTAWTEEHFSVLKRVASHLCFLPDADPPKPNERFGPGIKAVMKSGETAMRLGFSVSVKQIPVTEEKQDPDTFCTSKNIFTSIEEQDFILWMAEYLFTEGMTTEQQGKVIKQLSALMALIDDDTTIEMYIAQLTRYVGNKSMWKRSVDKQRKENKEKEEKEKEEKESALYRQFGFNVENGKYYYSITENGSFYEWSNFTMEPLFHIKDSISPKRLYMLKNFSGKSELVEMKQEDLVSLVKFKQRVEGLGNYIWKATERELTKLKSFLYEKTETAVEIKQLGWQRYGFFAFGNGVFYNGAFLGVDEYGIVRIEDKGNYYLPANSTIYRDDIKLFQFERRFVHLGYSAVSLKDFTEQIFKVFGNNGRVGFIFYLATLFRDIVTRTTRSFPILNLFGPKGSGKSELGHTLMSFFIIENVPPNIQNSTLPALNDTVAAVANALVHIDEYKNDMEIKKLEFLKGLWDGTGRTRMNMDLDKKKEITSVDSGVILSGQEMPTADIALFSRLIFLTFTKSTFSDEEKREYNALKKMRRNGLSHLTLEILKLRNVIEADYPLIYQRTMDDVSDLLGDLIIEDRIMMNWVAPLAAFKCLEAKLNTSLTYKLMLDICVEGIKFQNAQCAQNNELAAFWNTVQYLMSEGEIIEGGDFRIVFVRRLKTDTVDVIWGETRPVLYIQKTRLFMLYKKNGRAVGDSILPVGTLRHYLEHCREYLGEKSGVRYTVYHKGIVKMQSEGGINKEAKQVQRSYCFDYNKLVETYNINMMCASEKDGDTARQEDYEAEHPKQQDFPF